MWCLAGKNSITADFRSPILVLIKFSVIGSKTCHNPLFFIEISHLKIPNMSVYFCSYVAKVEKKIFFWKNICVFYKIYIICRKKCFYMEKKFYNENVFYWKKTFFTEKNINENVKNLYLISEIYFYAENVCVTNKI